MHRRAVGGEVSLTMPATADAKTAPSAHYTLRKAMFIWDISHYGYELLYWCMTFAVYFVTAIWDEAFNIQASAELQDASVGRRLADSAEYEYEVTGAEGAGADSVDTDEFSPGELSGYVAVIVSVLLALIIKYLIFPWVFMSFVPRMRNLSNEGFCLMMFCVLKAFGKIVKLFTDYALPYYYEQIGSANPPELTAKPELATSIGEYLADFAFAPWLFLLFVLPLLKSLVVVGPLTKREAEP